MNTIYFRILKLLLNSCSWRVFSKRYQKS